MSVTDAARATDTTPATARRCLLTLEAMGYLSHDGKYFTPTPRMVRLGAAYLETSPLPLLAQPHVVAARDELGESVSLAVLDGGHALFVARAEVTRIVSTGVRLGARLPAHASATGRVLMAGLPDEAVDELLRRSQPERTTPGTVVSVDEIRERVLRARDEGMAVTDEELEVGMRSLAVPVRDNRGRTHAAMSVAAFTARVSLEDMRASYAPVLLRHAARLGQKL
jgi:IclR family pca regulon transcriptional regulator